MRRAPLLLFLAGLIAVGGCGSQKEATPVACLEGAEVYVEALAAAPGDVRLQGRTPISGCLVKNQSAADLAAVGAAMLRSATALNGDARRYPGARANVQLGYLLGAATRGAEETEGIHDELLRRLEAAARYSPGDGPLPPAFRRAYRSGYAAGQRNG